MGQCEGWMGEGAPFVVQSFSQAGVTAGELGQVGEGGRARKQPLIIPRAVIHLTDRGN